MKQKVSVIGIGRLGLSFALLVNSKGYDVCGCDVNEEYITSLEKKTFNSNEPCINEMLENSSMTFTTNSTDAFEFSSTIFLFVPTPSKENGAYDHQYIEQVITELESYPKLRHKTIVIGCTVMPKYCQALQDRLHKYYITVLYNPEFISQGNIIYGLKNADIVLTGGRIPRFVYDIYTAIMDRTPNFKVLSLTGAEIAKISINCFLTMKIAYANMIGEIAINSGEGVNVYDILKTIGSDTRIGEKYLSYGFSAGGVCFPRDQKALGVHAKEVGINTTFTNDIDVENKRHAEFLKEYWMKANPNKNVPFVFSYLGYKKGVDILTESYQFKLCMDLLKEGYKVDVPKGTAMLYELVPYDLDGKVTFGEEKNGVPIN